MIVISDGDPSPPSNTILAQYKTNNIKVSTVAVGAHGPAESSLLQSIATSTGGKYYRVNNPKAPAADFSDRGPPRRAAAGQGRFQRAFR